MNSSEFFDLYKKLVMKACRLMPQRLDHAHDFAMDTTIELMSLSAEGSVKEGTEYFLAQFILRQKISTARKNKSTGQYLRSQTASVEIALQNASVPPSQEHALILSDVFAILKKMNPKYSNALILNAEGYTDREISQILNEKEPTVRNHITYARYLLKNDYLWDKEDNKSSFVGIKKAWNKWVAEIHIKKGQRIYLGMFDSASEAALAYDAAVREHFNGTRKLNFPKIGEDKKAQRDNKIVEMRRDGKSLNDIASYVGLSKGGVCVVLKRNAAKN